jgi:hypothetical protein
VNNDNKPITLEQADLIRAAIEGKTVQWRVAAKRVPSAWMDYDSDALDVIACLAGDLMRNTGNYEFRVKPEPVVRWIGMYEDGEISWGYSSTKGLLIPSGSCPFTKALRLTIDPDTHEVQTWVEPI